MKFEIIWYDLTEIIDTFNLDVGILDIELLALTRCRVEPFPGDGVIVGASRFAPRVNTPERGRRQLRRDLPNLTPRVVTEKVELFWIVEVERCKETGIGVVRPPEGTGQVVDGVRDFAIGVDGVEDLKCQVKKDSLKLN